MSKFEKYAIEMADQAREQWNEFWDIAEECSAILKEIAPIDRRPWLVHVIEEIHLSQNGVCPLCSHMVELGQHHVDHLVPVKFGGGNERANLQVVHPGCNRKKGIATNAWDLIRALEDRYMNRPQIHF